MSDFGKIPDKNGYAKLVMKRFSVIFSSVLFLTQSESASIRGHSVSQGFSID